MQARTSQHASCQYIWYTVHAHHWAPGTHTPLAARLVEPPLPVCPVNMEPANFLKLPRSGKHDILGFNRVQHGNSYHEKCGKWISEMCALAEGFLRKHAITSSVSGCPYGTPYIYIFLRPCLPPTLEYERKHHHTSFMLTLGGPKRNITFQQLTTHRSSVNHRRNNEASVCPSRRYQHPWG